MLFASMPWHFSQYTSQCQYSKTCSILWGLETNTEIQYILSLTYSFTHPLICSLTHFHTYTFTETFRVSLNVLMSLTSFSRSHFSLIITTIIIVGHVQKFYFWFHKSVWVNMPTLVRILFSIKAIKNGLKSVIRFMHCTKLKPDMPYRFNI